MVAGALACFGAGTAMPQFQTLVLDNLKSGQTVASPTRPSSHSLADVAVKPNALKVAEPKLRESTSNASNLNAVPDANGAAPPTTNSAERNASAANQSAPAAKEAIAGLVAASVSVPRLFCAASLPRMSSRALPTQVALLPNQDFASSNDTTHQARRYWGLAKVPCDRLDLALG